MPNNVNLSEFFDSIRATLAEIKSNTSSVNDIEIVGTYIEEDGSDPAPDVSSINFVNGTTGDDVPLNGSEGLDLVLARSGNDMLVGYGSIDILLGSDDVDTIDYSYLNDTENGIFIDLRSGIAVSKGGDIDLLSSIENAIGTVNDDVMLGNGLNNIFFGNGGSDIIDGRGGNKDVAQFAGKAEDYDIKTNEDGSVSITKDGDTTTLYNIELVQFGEGSEVGDIHLFSVTDGALVAHNDAIDVTETTDDDESEVAATFNVLGNDDEIGETGGQVITQLAFKTAGGAIVNVDAVANADGMLEVEGKYGTLLLDVETGEASYVYSEEANRLTDGQKGVDTFVYQVVGGDKAEFKVTVTGSNDAPTIGDDISLNFVPIVEWPGTEDAGYVHSRSGVFEVHDPDTVVNPTNFEVIISEPNLTLASGAGDILEMPGDIYASLTSKDTNFLIWTFDKFDDQGRVSYSYKVQDKAIDFLAEGDVLTIEYTLKVQDTHDPNSFVERPVTVNIIGTNDQPEILVEQSVLDFAVDEDLNANPQNIGELTGNIVVDDPDLGDTLYISVEGNGSPAYSEGDLPDGVDINTLLTAGNFDFTSGTALDNIFAVPKGEDGNVEFTYAYNGSANLDWLADGETLTLTFDVKVSDRNWFPEGTDTTQITITITGTNDVPTLTAVDVSGSIVEGDPSTLSDTGSIEFTDLDLSDTPTATFAVKSVEGLDGVGLTPSQIANIQAGFGLSADPGNANNGTINWSYSVAEEHLDFLAAGEKVEVVYTVTVDDGNGGVVDQDVTITITGTNDAPTIGNDISLNFVPIVELPGTEDAGYVHSRSGVFEVHDPDTVVNPTNFEVIISEPNLTLASGAGDILEMPGDIYASLTSKDTNFLIWTFDKFDDQGRVSYSYKVQDKAIDFLAEGDVLTIEYTLKVQDTHDPNSFVERPVTVNIIGTNDQPEILVEQSVLDFAVDEDLNANPQNIGELTGNIVVDDPDLGDTLYISVEGNGSPAYSEGDLPDGVDINTLLTAGNFDFTSGTALDNIFAVPKGEDGNVEFTYAYNGSANLDWLADGETLTLTFDVKVSDRNWFPEGTDTTQITITITGTNDGPVFSSGVFEGVIEEANTPAELETSGEVFFTDLDLSDTPEVTAQFTSVEPVAGSGFTLTEDQKVAFANALTVQQTSGNANNGSATWTFAIAATALDFLAAGEQLEVKYLLTVTDDSGETDTREVMVVVTGTNDDPTILSADILGEVTEAGVGESGTDAASGQIVGDDVDIRDVLTYSASVVDGALGHFSIDENTGAWTYTIDQSNAYVQALNEGDSVEEIYTVTVSDNNGGTVTTDVTITINGTNDAPTIENYTGSFTVVHSNTDNEESSFNLLELLNANDVDDGETETLQIDEITGTLSLAIAGHQVTLDIADLEAAGLLNIGEADGSVTFTQNLERIMAQVMDKGETANISGTVTVKDVHEVVSNSADFDIELSVDPDKTNTFGGDDWTTADGAGDIPEMLIPTFGEDGDHGPVLS
ncbi:VCBS domain-containing protein [Roseibium sp. FZY0029]|uniref:VCBS domain-containing protein n=1 Tax=Roseibium sp. FZY0029 TaxID=3116647 RepID=UPI002EBB802C|nr:VCBS domain-containing protein [Roseibium sp. FZY0029]